MLSWYDGFGWGHKLTIRDEDPDFVLDGVVCFSTYWALPFCVKQPATGFTTIFTGGSLRDYCLFMSDQSDFSFRNPQGPSEPVSSLLEPVDGLIITSQGR